MVFVLAAVGCVVFAALEYGKTPDRDWNTWLSVVIWASIAVVLLSQLTPNAAYLKLDAELFEVKAFFRRWSCSWLQVEAIRVEQPFGVVRIVVLDLVHDAEVEVKPPARSRWLRAHQGRLPSTYGLPPQELVSLMLAYKHGADAAQQVVSGLLPSSEQT
jgi:hypothetical protein